MKVKAELLNVIFYNNKKDSSPRTWIRYRLLDPKYKVNTDKMLGFSILDEYIRGQDLKEILNENCFGVECDIEFKEIPLESNPLNTVRKMTSIRVGSNVINLV